MSLFGLGGVTKLAREASARLIEMGVKVGEEDVLGRREEDVLGRSEEDVLGRGEEDVLWRSEEDVL